VEHTEAFGVELADHLTAARPMPQLARKWPGMRSPHLTFDPRTTSQCSRPPRRRLTRVVPGGSSAHFSG
jgi:hypothetical protein